MALAAQRLVTFYGDDCDHKTLALLPMRANVKIYKGAIVGVDSSGNGMPCAATTSLRVAGICEETVDNTGGLAGAKSVRVRRGTLPLKNDGVAPVRQNEAFATVYAVDDEAVSRDDAGATRPAVGKFVGEFVNGQPVIEVM